MKIAAFVEGSRERPDSDDPLELLWARDLPDLIGVPHFDRVVPISKHHLVAMDALNRGLAVKTSTLTVGLDQLIASELSLGRFDAAIVAWDLQPPWDRSVASCRWNETLSLYRGLASSPVLPEDWRSKAAARLADLEVREHPSDRVGPPTFEPGLILPVCAVPLFEDVFMNEAGVRGTLGVSNRQVHGWPSGWKDCRNPKDVLSRAISAARGLRPKPLPLRKMFIGFEQAPHEWASFLIRNGDGRLREDIRQHRVALRIAEISR